eukprot:9512863-Karenia_brevis.AAC.1
MNAFGRLFDGGPYGEFEGQAGIKYDLALSVIGMGNLNAVDVAQQTHLGVLKKAGCMKPGTVLEYRNPIPISDVLE